MRISDFKANFVNGVRPNLFKMFISGFPRKLEFLCKGSQLPGKTIGQVEVPYLNLTPKVAGDKVFDNLALTILMDTDLSVRNELEAWMETISNNDAMFGADLAEYTRKGNLIVLNNNGDDLAEYEFINIWPTVLSPIEMSFETKDTIAEYTCDFSFDYWNRLQ